MPTGQPKHRESLIELSRLSHPLRGHDFPTLLKPFNMDLREFLDHSHHRPILSYTTILTYTNYTMELKFLGVGNYFAIGHGHVFFSLRLRWKMPYSFKRRRHWDRAIRPQGAVRISWTGIWAMARGG